jgi:hypothetical protein
MRERRQTYRIRVAAQEPIEALLYVGGRDVPVILKDESLEGFGVHMANELPLAEGDLLHLQSPQGWFAVTVVRIVWNSDGSCYVGLRRGRAERPPGRRNPASLSRTTLLLAVAAGALIVPLLTMFLGQSSEPSAPPKADPQPAATVEKSLAVSPPSR